MQPDPALCHTFPPAHAPTTQGPTPVPTRLGVAALLLAALTAAAAPTPPLPAPLVITQVPRRIRLPTQPDPSSSRTRHSWFNAARLLLLDANHNPRVLTEDFDVACDPNVSFDGQRLLFAGAKDHRDNWRIYELTLATRSVRPISPDSLDARNPIHVSTLFTLDSPEPWFTTVFVGREPRLTRPGQFAAPSLYNIKLDGTDLRQLTFNPSASLDPFQMPDGRVLYVAHHHPHEPLNTPGRMDLFTIHVEGADVEQYAGGIPPTTLRSPCTTPQGLVVFVESNLPLPDGSGQLAAVATRRPFHSYQSLTHDPSYRFLSPSPLDDDRILVARRPAQPNATAAIVTLNLSSSECQTVFDCPDFHEIQAVTLAPRTTPDGHSTVVETTPGTGVFYGLNAYDADPRLAPHLRPGTIQRVRFIEGVLQPDTPGATTPTPAASPILRRLVGEAPVESDGSFNVEVPADVPLLIQTLDTRGFALATCGWVWVKPKEKRGCIGCHEDPERIPENTYTLALQRPSNRLVLPPDQRRTITFIKDIAPILQNHCATADCHGSRKHDLHLPLRANPPTKPNLLTAYNRLVAPANPRAAKENPAPPKGRYLDPGRARTSPLAWHLLGSNTSQPWDHPAQASQPAQPVPLMPPQDHDTPLQPEQIRTLIQWIDLGAPFDIPTSP